MIHIRWPRRVSGGEAPRHRHNDTQAAALSEGEVWCTVGDCEWAATAATADDLIEALTGHYSEKHKEDR